MISRLEISGFKTFTGFSIDFMPFTVIAGTNGSGKSNLFDAIQLLGSIADTDLQSAFDVQRGEARELFTLRPDGTYATEMRFAVELLLNKQVQDKFGGQATLKYTRLRYEVQIQRLTDSRGFDRLTVAYERLVPIAKATDEWFKDNTPRGGADVWRPSTHGGATPFINTRDSDTTLNGAALKPQQEIYMRQDGTRGGRPSPALELEQTVLSSVTKTDFPHVFAAKQEMLNWRFLQLNPVELRKPSSFQSNGKGIVAADGANLPAALARMMADDHGLLHRLSREVHRLLPSIRQLELERDEPKQQHVLYATMSDGRKFSSRVLSEGTLRLIALCAFKYDDRYEGVLCFEEPENGIHPYRLHNMIELLRDLATDFSDPSEPVLRQLLVNTHSPGLLAALVAIEQETPFTALFASLVPRTAPNTLPSLHTVMLPISFSRQQALDFDGGSISRYTLQEAINYLQSEDVEKAIEQLTTIQQA
ncbi:AAA family ATPase [Hymenobacter sp. IS2118]|uniref:AAA family ATPase n=1 Tax=Hymenobacter sp. IS2118 TaxID=1505605 RepID=UPI000551AB9C|nr:AAA family ATPase [Hymenobacter sp. IS2118]